MINDHGAACLSDFGISRILHRSGFTTKSVAGTVRWMAVELLISDDDADDDATFAVTTESDVWAFAMTVLEVCLDFPDFGSLHFGVGFALVDHFRSITFGFF